MKFALHQTATPTPRQGTPVNRVGAGNLSVLLEAGRRLAAVLPICLAAQCLNPAMRLASVEGVRTQARVCIAALGIAGAGELSALKNLLAKAIQSIQSAPNEATARALYDSPRVQEALWAWATAEASLFVKNMVRHAPVDEDKQADLVGDAVMGFMREKALRPGENKLNPFSMARSWQSERMPDPLGTLRVYLQAWVKNSVQSHSHQQAHEGISLDAPADGVNGESTASIGDLIEDKHSLNPESALVNSSNHQTKTAAMVRQFEKQVASLQADIDGLSGKADSYSVGQRTMLNNRLSAIRDMVAPFLEKLQQTSDALASVEGNRRLDPTERERQVSTYRKQFDAAMQNLSAISEAQERAHGARLNREEASTSTGQTGDAPAERVYKHNKPISDPLSTEYAYTRARANADRLLPHVYRALTHTKNSDLSKKYTSNIITNWRLLGGIDTQNDLNTALSSDPFVRANANDQALFTTTAIRIMMTLRDLYAYDEKHSVIRGHDETGQTVPKSAKQRFKQLMQQEIERDPVLQQRAAEQFDLLNEFVAGNSFLAMWNNADYIARAAAYEWARNEKVDKRWDALSPDDTDQVADAAGSLLYSDHRPFAVWSQGDAQRRVTKDLNLSPEERKQIMREETGRITQMMQGALPRGTWAHGEPVNSTRFHDRLRAARPTQSPESDENDTTIFTAALPIRNRRFAMS